MKQTSIRDFENPYNGRVPMVDVETSKQAAESMESSAKLLRNRILQFIRFREGATCEEVEVELGIRHQSASARIRELVLQEKLLPTEKRANRSGRMAMVYVVNEAVI